MAKYKRFKPWMLNGHPGNVSRACKRAIVRGHNAGLVVTATTDGAHAATSYHYPRGFRGARGRAVDFGLRRSEIGTARGLAKIEAFQVSEARRPIRHNEVFGPRDELCVKNGRRIVMAHGSALEIDHRDHLHLSPRW